MDGKVAVVGLGEDAMDAVLLEQPCHHGAERLRRQSAALRGGREGDAHLGGLRLIGRDPHRAVAAERSAHPVDGRQLQPRPWVAEGDISLRGDEPFRVSRRVRRIPRLVARDVGVAAVGGEGRHIADLKWSQHQPLGHDLQHGAIVLPQAPDVRLSGPRSATITRCAASLSCRARSPLGLPCCVVLPAPTADGRRAVTTTLNIRRTDGQSLLAGLRRVQTTADCACR